ncbi:hypothetical protein UFOVP223_62 [uncultured Caudovirales phage]|uniref:Uncharacterized protein n=1 Tax=uncultured Caudovirales phage TaxID=2100421 RepID=A0A6J7WRI9_9CAUD|nr:hypothetical protein UFOVP110_102 [uncultured Caudovirales phage]CAB5219352.1 hypothetical protein UFOVP223_62 [uncultured Caudovirales phage]
MSEQLRPVAKTSGVYNTGAALDGKPFQARGTNAAVTQSLSVSEQGLTSKTKYYTLNSSSYKGNPSNGGNGALG